MRELKTNTWPRWIVHVNPRYIHPIHSQQIPHFVNRQLTLIWMTYITFVQKFSDFSYALIGRELSGLCVNACMQQVTGRCLWSIGVQWHQESDTLYSGDNKWFLPHFAAIWLTRKWNLYFGKDREKDMMMTKFVDTFYNVFYRQLHSQYENDNTPVCKML